jgi:hypothetical protein
MPKIKDPDRLATSFASGSMRQFSALKAALQAAEESMSRLHAALNVPVIHPPRGYIRGSRTRPGALLTAGASGLGGFLAHQISGSGGLLDDLFGGGDGIDFSGGDIGGSFQTSATQFAARLFDASLRGQRIR